MCIDQLKPGAYDLVEMLNQKMYILFLDLESHAYKENSANALDMMRKGCRLLS